MKIYNKIVIDLKTDEVIFKDSFEHIGEVALCGGGGSDVSTTTFDKDLEAGILALSEEQQGWGRSMYNMFTYGTKYDPTEDVQGAWIDNEWVAKEDLPGTKPDAYWTWSKRRQKEWKQEQKKLYDFPDDYDSWTKKEQRQWRKTEKSNWDKSQSEPTYDLVTRNRGEMESYNADDYTTGMDLMQSQIDADTALLPGQTALSEEKTALGREETAATLSLLPGQTALLGEQTTAARSLLPGQTALSRETTADARTAIGQRAPVREKYYKEASEGVNIKERMELAQADVAKQYEGAAGIGARALARRGGNVTDTDFMSKLSLGRAKDIASARTTARTTGKDINFQRLRDAMTLGGE